jgi:protein-L-isoaspartate(D-aspartate) O-methyltransferase
MNNQYLMRGLRRKMIEGLQQQNLFSKSVLEAMAEVPRHVFVPPAFDRRAYDDQPLPIGLEQTISQPSTVAFQTTLAQVGINDRVLEIGTGSGYQAAVLAQLHCKLCTVERIRDLFLVAQQRLNSMYPGRVRCFLRDGQAGLPECAPYDAIVVTAGAADVPAALIEQLVPGGRLIIPMGEKKLVMHRFTKLDDGLVKTETFGQFKFVPLLGGLLK